MISLRKLSFGRGGRMLVTDASMQIHPGWKVGLVGANGCGKSSFFALFSGTHHAEQGDLDWPAGWLIGRVSQETPALPDPAREFVLGGDEELVRVETELRAAEAAHEGERIALLHGRLQEIDGYAARARAAELLHGLGFRDEDFERPVAEFSGGWRVRLNLARALMCRADLLLLDEPTNHLDLDAILWLETWLRRFPGTVLVVSHDRDFLDGLVSHVVAIEQGTMTFYSGDYSAYERTRAERLALQQSTFEKQQREVAHLKSYIDRFRAKATKARQAQSRIKALARMELVAAAHVDADTQLVFPAPVSAPDPLLVLEDAATGYSATPLLQRLRMTLRPGDRIGILGRNGAGKSTFIKLLTGDLPLLQGTRQPAKELSIGYFAQHQLERLRPDESPMQQMIRLDPAVREQELRDWLGRFAIRGDMAMNPCGAFSGGEKARLALALMLRHKPNLLLLDEPTNHLDLDMREALTLALQEYEGAVVLVSHDRHLLRATADELWLVAGGDCRPFDGDLEDYAGWLGSQRSADKAVDAEKRERRESRAQAIAERQSLLEKRRPLLKESDRLEKQLAGWQGEKTLLDQRLADPALYVAGADGRLLETLLRRQDELAASIEAAESRWLEVHENLEALDAPDAMI
ncbi:MAG: ATP-binding cassette domain-containing protein [Proteobacteria bacterium]|nr:ATP-binding cassette domain-containing protein [Pseudomonadota bacterium]HQR03849.1 ATP-binding cassette domain-containing protein [Rhodocyclaceae bacterium]